MEYKFECIGAGEEEVPVIIAMFEGDNEIAICDVGSNGTSAYLLLIVNMGSEDPFILVQSEHATVLDALDALNRFLRDEYAAHDEVAF